MSQEHAKLRDQAARFVKNLNASYSEINNAADVSARVQEITVSATVTPGVQAVELKNATTGVKTATIADLANHQGIFSIKYTSTQTTADRVKLTAGTFSSTGANLATLNALGESVVFYVDSAGNGSLLSNVGSAVLSTT
jgi:hypothetical protein